MQIRNLATALFMLSCLTPLAVPAKAQDSVINQPQAFAKTFETSTMSVNVNGTDIAVYLYKPRGYGKFPLLIISHGCPRLAKDRLNFGPNTCRKQAEAYASNGVFVAVPIRRGYAGQGQWCEGYGGAENPDYYNAGLAGAQDIEAVVEAVSRLPAVDPSRVALMGISAGAWASVAAGGTPVIMGVVSFAAGRGSKGPDNVCHEENLIGALKAYGRASHAPELWIYSENDHFFSLALARRMYDAFTSAGGQATFIAAPPYGDDGHHYFNNISSWKSEVDSFLQHIGFLTNQASSQRP